MLTNPKNSQISTATKKKLELNCYKLNTSPYHKCQLPEGSVTRTETRRRILQQKRRVLANMRVRQSMMSAR